MIFTNKKKNEFERIRTDSFEILQSAICRLSENARKNYPAKENAKYDLTQCLEIITKSEQLLYRISRVSLKGSEYESLVIRESLSQAILGMRTLVDEIWDGKKCSGSSSQD